MGRQDYNDFPIQPFVGDISASPETNLKLVPLELRQVERERLAGLLRRHARQAADQGRDHRGQARQPRALHVPAVDEVGADGALERGQRRRARRVVHGHRPAHRRGDGLRRRLLRLQRPLHAALPRHLRPRLHRSRHMERQHQQRRRRHRVRRQVGCLPALRHDQGPDRDGEGRDPRVDAQGAKQNLNEDAPDFDFATKRAPPPSRPGTSSSAASASTAGRPSRSASSTPRSTTMVVPNAVSDVNGHYRASTTRSTPRPAATQNYSGWDIYRSWSALLAFDSPDVASDFVASPGPDGQQGGRCPSGRGDGRGDHHDRRPGPDLVAERLRVRRPRLRHGRRAAADAQERMQAGVKDNQYVIRQGLADYLAEGYIPMDPSTTLEYSVVGLRDLVVRQRARRRQGRRHARGALAVLAQPVQPRDRLHPAAHAARLVRVAVRPRVGQQLRRGQRRAVHLDGPARPGRPDQRAGR